MQDLLAIHTCGVFNVLQIEQQQWPFKNISSPFTGKLA